MNTATLELFDMFRKTLPEADARQAVHALGNTPGTEARAAVATEAAAHVEKALERESKTLATKGDLHAVKVDLIKWVVGSFLAVILAMFGLAVALANLFLGQPPAP